MVEEIRDENHIVVPSEIDLERIAGDCFEPVQNPRGASVFSRHLEDGLVIESRHKGARILPGESQSVRAVAGGDIQDSKLPVLFQR